MQGSLLIDKPGFKDSSIYIGYKAGFWAFWL